MPNPRVFVSSTCYDLKYIRESLRNFIISMGFEPVLSERGNVFYNPLMNVQDACLAEVRNCQIFLLIIGGRAGSQYKNTASSITNVEYREAVKNKIPIFALVEQEVLGDYLIFKQNKENKNIDVAKLNYRAIDTIKIFDFMEEVQKNAINNALTPFSSITELQSFLKQQWAAMMYTFLSEQSENKRVASVLDSLTIMSERIEFLAKQILQIVGTNSDKAMAEINEKMQKHKIYQFLTHFPLADNIDPVDIVKYADMIEIMNKLNFPIIQDEKQIYFVLRKTSGFETKIVLSNNYLYDLQLDYDSLRREALSILKKYNVSIEDIQ